MAVPALIALWYFSVLRKYFTFQGRASRAELWSFILVDALTAFILFRLSGGWTPLMDHIEYSSSVYWGLWMGLYQAFTLLPLLAVMVRRLHDTNRSGRRFFITLIPIVGPIMLLINLCQASSPLADEQYGEAPLRPNVTFASLGDYLWRQAQLCGRILFRPYRAFNEVSGKHPDLLSLIVIGAAHHHFGRHIAMSQFGLYGDTETTLFLVGVLIGLVIISWVTSWGATRCCGKLSAPRAFNIMMLACVPITIITIALQRVIRFLHFRFRWFEHLAYGEVIPWLNIVISCLFAYTLVLALYGLFVVRRQAVKPMNGQMQEDPNRSEYQPVICNPLSTFVMMLVCTFVYFGILTMILRLLRSGALSQTLLIPVSTALGAITAYLLWGNQKQGLRNRDARV